MWLQEYHRNGGEYVKYKQCHHYEMHKNVKHMGILEASLGYPLRHAPSMPGAVEGVHALRKAGHEVYFLTAAPTVWCHDANERKLQWLSEHFKERQDKWYISCPSHAKEFLKGDVLIEDSEATLRNWQRTNPAGKGYLIQAPYNPDGVTWEFVLKELL
jgi:5'(3')-deoxyribonucleotidase